MGGATKVTWNFEDVELAYVVAHAEELRVGAVLALPELERRKALAAHREGLGLGL